LKTWIFHLEKLSIHIWGYYAIYKKISPKSISSERWQNTNTRFRITKREPVLICPCIRRLWFFNLMSWIEFGTEIFCGVLIWHKLRVLSFSRFLRTCRYDFRCSFQVSNTWPVFIGYNQLPFINFNMATHIKV
jgi:hypothetical protein